MSILMVGVLWYSAGLIGCIVIVYGDWKNGIDFYLKDIFIVILISCGGLITLIGGLIYISNLEWSTVLLKGKKQ